MWREIEKIVGCLDPDCPHKWGLTFLSQIYEISELAIGYNEQKSGTTPLKVETWLTIILSSTLEA